MAETRQQLKERLQSAGLWQEYLSIREECIADGLTPSQAKAEALEQIERQSDQSRKRPAAPVDPEIVESGTPQALPDFSRRIPSADAVDWVAQNLANPNVRPEESPSGMAWGLLEWVRMSSANKTTFWTTIWPKLLPTGAALKNRNDTTEIKEEPVMQLLEDYLAEIRRNKKPCTCGSDAAY
jgi:hypothetical protein